MERPEFVWEDPQCPFRVEWAPDKLDQARIAVVDAFYALPRGGLEIGGVLLGRFDGQLLQIDDFAVVECEHLTGPSFVFSTNDEAALERQLAGLEKRCLGWFHSHTRSEISFSSKDLELHNRFFPEPWQIAMVLRPANLKPLRANYFFRNAAGTVVPGSDEFVVGAQRGQKPEDSAPSPEMAVPEFPPRPDAKPKLRQEPAPIAVAEAPPPPVKQEVPPPRFSFLVEEPLPVRKRNYVWPAAFFAMVALGGTAFFTRELWMPKAVEPLKLRASDVGGKLIVRWNPVHDEPSGQLHIDDGSKASDVKLDGLQLSHGLYVYTRQSPAETIRLKVGAREDITSFAGPLTTSQEADAETLKAKEEAEKLAAKVKAELAAESARNKQLQQKLKNMQKRLDRRRR